jgi:hypothetical protein
MTYRPVIAKRPDAEMQRFQRQLPRIERRSGHRFARRPGAVCGRMATVNQRVRRHTPLVDGFHLLDE